MKKTIIAFTVALSFSSAFTSLAYADLQGCKKLSPLAKSYAQIRDRGDSLDTLTSSLEVGYGMGNISEDDKISAQYVASLVYTRFKDLSPAQTQKQFYLDCVSANR